MYIYSPINYDYLQYIMTIYRELGEEITLYTNVLSP